MPLALFDLDNTLLADDSDYLWGVFLVEKGLVDKQQYEAANQQFYAEYKAGKLDILAFLAFSLKPLSQHPVAQLNALHQEFMQRYILPVMTEKGKMQIQQHKAQGDTVIIITATNRFVTQPIANAFGADVLIATEPAMQDGQYTGGVEGIPCFQQGKIERLNDWLAQTDHKLKDSWFYSDSHNDIPLLEKVTYPVAVDPDDSLKQLAIDKGWTITSFR